MGLKIVQSDTVHNVNGDFGAEIRDGKLLLPKAVINFARLMGAMDNSDELLKTVASFHGNVEALLKCNGETRHEATVKLLRQLDSHTSEATRKFVEKILGVEKW